MRRARLALLALLLGFAPLLHGRGAMPEPLPEVSVAQLPAEAHATIQLIERGGPFPYDRDGTVFNNFEKRLPVRGRGYYREYTVRTPGTKGRGVRRIVAGRAGELYYTEDHYRSFRRIREDVREQ